MLYCVHLCVQSHYVYLWAEHMKRLDCEMMFTVVQKNDHYCGGTEKGVNYLQKEAPWQSQVKLVHIRIITCFTFLNYVDDFKSRKVHQRDDADSSSLRVKVKELFNHQYGKSCCINFGIIVHV